MFHHSTETAINIGYSSMLLTENMNDVFVVEGDDTKTVHDNLKKCQAKMDSFTTLEGNAPKIVFSSVKEDHEAVPLVS